MNQKLLGLLLLVVLILLIAGGIFYLQHNKPQPGVPGKTPAIKVDKNADAQKAAAMQKVLRETMVSLPAINNSGESGVATFKDLGNKIEVTIIMTVGFPKDTPQPAHIHLGDCPGVGDIKYPLNNLINGRSVTTLDVSLADLQKQLPLAINVHKSASDMKSYVACGPIGKDPALSTTPATK